MREDRLTPAELAELARASGRIGIDTEFVSEGRYRALLCLVQVAVDSPGGPHVEILDPIEGFDHEPIAALLADPEIEIVIHAGSQDVAILRRTWQTEINNIFDTQISAGFAGFSAQASYANLVQGALGIHVAKTASFTRWDVRPLTNEQIDYAVSDVEDVLALADELQARLERTGRLTWAREECRRLESVTDERDPEAVYKRLPRVNQLRPRPRTVARELAAWRERTAAAEDRPVGSVLADMALVEIAKRQPTQPKEIGAIRGVRGDVVRKRGEEIVAAVRRGQEAPPLPPDDARRPPPDPSDAPLVALSEAVVRARALEAGLAYELVATRSDLGEIVARARRREGEPEVRTLHGWRRDLVGAELLELLSGGLTLAVDDEGGLTIRDGRP